MDKKPNLITIALTIVALSLSVAAQSVVVTKKKATYTRPNPHVDFKKTFTVHRPQVRARTRAISRKIETALSYETIFDVNINEEIRESHWLDDADFKVIYNKLGLLGVELWVEGSAAYPSGMIKNIVIDTRTGNRVKPGEVFVYVNGLVTMIKTAQKAEIAAAMAEIRKDPEMKETEPEELFEGKDFMTNDLTHFSITDQGITFHYDYGFPHVIKAHEPDGKYTFTWAQMKPYNRSGGLLSRLAR